MHERADGGLVRLCKSEPEESESSTRPTPIALRLGPRILSRGARGWRIKRSRQDRSAVRAHERKQRDFAATAPPLLRVLDNVACEILPPKSLDRRNVRRKFCARCCDTSLRRAAYNISCTRFLRQFACARRLGRCREYTRNGADVASRYKTTRRLDVYH